ncbi:efflux RND transporter periplasmic adaptor subunit [Geothrix sp. PMB-07]|uniref:efflux RND transporter periplasmic adaptor subunit n=1 Tax=Geothrix sp. PMB-07 TaxID=3068640 RepID=UPI002741BB0E|nr:efflux RND transporter periplasmic adaptor subunit [Geothrix sp. PMB-07]WLT32496.1 efflux RND transporter periplasmic adaptor subunit [Geothrix sp. PMB-07]
MSMRSALLVVPFLAGAVCALAAGSVEGRVLPFRQVEVSAPVSSRIAELKVKEGDLVKEGQPLALLYGKLEELEMQRAKALLERREFEAKSAKRLYDNKIIPEAKAMETRIDLDLAKLQYESAAEQVRLRTVLAPLDGVVVTTARETGETVSAGQPLFRILDLSKVVVQLTVDADALGTLAPGRHVRVNLRKAAEPLEGRVTLVDPCADAEGRVRVRVVVENTDRKIRSGIRARVDWSDAQ